MTRLKCDTHRQHWGSRGTRRRNICTPKSCGSWGWRRDSRSTASSSASSPTLWWCPGQGPSWAPRSSRLPSSSTTIVERRIGLPGEEREVFASLLILSKGLLWLERNSTVFKIPGSKDQLPFGAQFDYLWSSIGFYWIRPHNGGKGVVEEELKRKSKLIWSSLPRNNLDGIRVLLISILIKLSHLEIFEDNIYWQWGELLRGFDQSQYFVWKIPPLRPTLVKLIPPARLPHFYLTFVSSGKSLRSLPRCWQNRKSNATFPTLNFGEMKYISFT